MTLELVTKRWGVTPLGVGVGGRKREKGGSRDRLGEAGDGIGEAGHSGSGQGEGRSERGGWEKGKRGGQIKYR